jgi:Zn finger protein HypA/HybF involved in hydrogenase expression
MTYYSRSIDYEVTEEIKFEVECENCGSSFELQQKKYREYYNCPNCQQEYEAILDLVVFYKDTE